MSQEIMGMDYEFFWIIQGRTFFMLWALMLQKKIHKPHKMFADTV